MVLMSTDNTRSGLKGDGNSGSLKTVKATIEERPIKNDNAGLDHYAADDPAKQDAVA